MFSETSTLDPSDKESLMTWAIELERRQAEVLPFSALFSKQYLLKTVLLCVCWVAISCAYYNLSFLMPMLLRGASRHVMYLTVVASSVL
jgi:hypothetical protein